MHFLRKHRAFSAQEVLNVFVAILETISSQESTRSGVTLKRTGIRLKTSFQ